MIPRTIFSPEHETFRSTFRQFLETEVMPHHEGWEKQGFVDRSIWRRAGELGYLCTQIPEEYGGAGADRLFSAVILEEIGRINASGLGFNVHSDIVAVYIQKYGTQEQKVRWLPRMASGEIIGSIAMTEPSTGSDLQSIRTTAVADGDDYIINGSKIFITNGYHCDLAVVACKLESAGGDGKNITLFLIEAERAGFGKGKPLNKIGMKAQDTGELFFNDLRVPKTNLLGGANTGFMILMAELAWERLMIAIACVAGAESAFAHTIKYTKERHAFNRPIAAFQNTKYKLAELKSEIAIGRVFIDRCIELEQQKKLPIEAAAAAKYWSSELLCRVCDECLQLHGGYGYVLDYPIAKAYADARVQRIYGGTTEIMKEIISRTL